MTHLAVTAPVNERWVSVTAPARALALDIQTAANNLARSLGGNATTPHGILDAARQRARIRDLLDLLDDEL